MEAIALLEKVEVGDEKQRLFAKVDSLVSIFFF